MLNVKRGRPGRSGISGVVLLVLLVFCAAPLAVVPAAAQTTRQPTLRMADWTLDDLAAWEAGTSTNLLVTNNAGGELRLEDDQLEGSFVSAPFEAEFPFNTAGATWHAEIPERTTLTLELRATSVLSEGVSPLDDNLWGPWQPLFAADARSQKDATAYASPDVLAFQRGSRYLQLRARFTSSLARASAVLSDVSVTYIDSSEGVATGSGLQRGPILFGPATLTPRPTLVLRTTWSGQRSQASPLQATPRGIILHQIDAPPGFDDTTAMLRALVAYQTDTLGWDDLAYHYFIDDRGILYEGRLGGPTAFVPRLSGSDVAIHVVYIGSSAATPSVEAQGTLVSLLAWLGQAYAIAPEGRHLVAVDGAAVSRENIAGHSTITPTAPDPGPSLANQLPELRTRASNATVRARWYFAEGNLRDYSQRFIFYNPSEVAGDAVALLFDTASEALQSSSRRVALPAQSRADLPLDILVNQGVLTETPGLATIVEANVPVIAERILGLTSDIDGGPGLAGLSRIWYFAEGATDEDFLTYFVLFNPQTSATRATLNYIQDDGTVATKEVSIAAQQRTVVAVADTLRGARFGTQIVAGQPIAVERTMRFGPDARGLHTGQGTTTLARRWYFAEGTTENPFIMRLLLLNPNNEIANTRATFLRPDGTSEDRRYAIPPRTRLEVDVNSVMPEQGVATIVEADRPLAVERALYLREESVGTVSAGATEPAYTWYFADGRSNDVSYFLLFSNPGERPARVTVDFVFGGDGARARQQVLVPARARYTMAVSELYPGEASIAATVRSTQPIVAERSLYPGSGERGGYTSLGVPGE